MGGGGGEESVPALAGTENMEGRWLSELLAPTERWFHGMGVTAFNETFGLERALGDGGLRVWSLALSIVTSGPASSAAAAVAGP